MKKKTDFQKSVFERREKTDYYGREIWIVSKDDLILSKLWWAKDGLSEKQLTDVKNLMRNGFGGEYIKSWTERLKVSDLLEKWRSESSDERYFAGNRKNAVGNDGCDSVRINAFD